MDTSYATPSAGRRAEPAERPVEAARPTPKLTLAPARGQQLDGLLGALAKFYLLDVNGTALLTRRAAMEMKLIAVMLTINFLFDLAVWWLLWNMVFHSGRLAVGPWTLLAFLCGALFASIIFVYERQFMTADTYRRWSKNWWPVSIRLLVIAMAAAITTQPFEVMVFGGPIQRRIHDESIRVEALSRLRALEEAQARTRGAVGLAGTVEGETFREANENGTQAREKTNLLKGQAQARRAELQGAEASLRNAIAQRGRARTAQQAEAANRRVAAAQGRVGQAQSALRDAEARAAASEEDEKDWDTKVREAQQGVVAQQEVAKKDVQRLQNWITQIRNAPPGETVVENTEAATKWEFRDLDYDFFQRLGIINDLYFGRPARWFDATPENRQRLSALYNLSDPGEGDELVQRRRDSDAHTFKWSYWAVIGIAAVIPLLLLALKGLLPVDLKLYYSRRAQQAAGNYESLRFSVADGLTAAFEHEGEGSNGHRRHAPAEGAFE